MCFRVAMISYHTSPLAALGKTRDAGGMNVYVRELARELSRGSIRVDIFTRRSDPTSPSVQWINRQTRLIQISAGPAVPLPTTELFPYVEVFTQRVEQFAAHTGHAYELIHSHYWLSAVAGMTLAKRWDAPHATMFHTVERLKTQQYGAPVATSPAALQRIEYERRIAQTVDRVIVSTEHESEQLRRLYGLPTSRIRVIPCGVDLRAFTPGTPAERAAARSEVMPGDTPSLLFVGRLDPIKGLDLLLESVSLMRTRARLTVIGGDLVGDPELERLRSVAHALGIADRVTFAGALPQPELHKYYRAADALVVTSCYESFGLAAVEALASGTPVVASQVGGLPCVVRDGENGLLVHWRSAEFFAERLDQLLEDQLLRERLAAHARESVRRFDWHRIGDDVRDMYSSMTVDRRVSVACSCF